MPPRARRIASRSNRATSRTPGCNGCSVKTDLRSMRRRHSGPCPGPKLPSRTSRARTLRQPGGHTPGYGSKWFRHPANTFPPPVRVLVILESEAVWRQDRPARPAVSGKSSSGEYFMIGSSAPLHDRGWVAAQGPAIPGGETQIQVAFLRMRPSSAEFRIQQLFDGPRPAPTPPVLQWITRPSSADRARRHPFRIEWSRDLRTWNAAGDAIGQSPHVNLAPARSGTVPAFFRAVND